MKNKYLENTHALQSKINSAQSITWYTNSNSLHLSVVNRYKTKPGSKFAEIQLSPENARELMIILRDYLVKSGNETEVTHE